MNGPVSAERAQCIGRQAQQGLQPANLQHAPCPAQGKDQRHKRQQPRFHAKLNKSTAAGISPAGKPSAASPLANPSPCNRPNRSATSQGWRMVRLLSPRQTRWLAVCRAATGRALRKHSGQRPDGIWARHSHRISRVSEPTDKALRIEIGQKSPAIHLFWHKTC
jgi:hypothetical protein